MEAYAMKSNDGTDGSQARHFDIDGDIDAESGEGPAQDVTPQPAKRRRSSLAVLTTHGVLQPGTRLNLIRPPRPDLVIEDERIRHATFLQGNMVRWEYDQREYSLSGLCRQICIHCGGNVGAGAFAGPHHWAIEGKTVSLAEKAQSVGPLAEGVVAEGVIHVKIPQRIGADETGRPREAKHFGNYELSSGDPLSDTVFLSRLKMSRVYQGLMSGTFEWASEVIRQSLARNVAEAMPPGKPLVVLDDGSKVLPEFMWIAKFESSSGVRTDESFFTSQLFVCWFSDGISETFESDLQSVFEAADYEANAEDIDMLNDIFELSDEEPSDEEPGAEEASDEES
jgi:hypothetical protein